MRRLTKLEKFGLIAAIMVCGIYFYMDRVYDPEAKSLKKTVQKLNATIKQFNEIKAPPPIAPVKKTVERRKKELEKVTAELKEAGGRIGDPSEITQILALITGLARKNRLSLVKMTSAGEEKETMFTWAIFEAELAGGYHDFHMFIQDLRNLSQPVQLRELYLENIGGSGMIKITVTLLI